MEPSTHRDMSNMTFFVFTFDKIKKVYTLSEHQSDALVVPWPPCPHRAMPIWPRCAILYRGAMPCAMADASYWPTKL